MLLLFRYSLAVAVFALPVVCCADDAAESAEREKFFEQNVRPLLVARCLRCHGAEKQESGLRLDSRAALLAGGDSGEKGAVPGEPDQSLLVKAVRQAGDLKMPPKEKLSDREIETLAGWVKLGLPWPKSTVVTPASAAERAVIDRRSHWSYQPVLRPPLPRA